MLIPRSPIAHAISFSLNSDYSERVKKCLLQLRRVREQAKIRQQSMWWLILCHPDWTTGAQAFGETLFCLCLGACFWVRLT